MNQANLPAPESMVHFVQISCSHPALGNKTLLCHIEVEHVQRVVNCLDLLHFDKPILDILCSQNQNSVSVIRCLAENLSKAKKQYKTLT